MEDRMNYRSFSKTDNISSVKPLRLPTTIMQKGSTTIFPRKTFLELENFKEWTRKPTSCASPFVADNELGEELVTKLALLVLAIAGGYITGDKELLIFC